ncbi:MAG: transglutaminase domain-containing protein, partial [Deltaproteobacteria bacterium]
ILLDGWGRVRTSGPEGRRIAAVAQALAKQPNAERGPLAGLLARSLLLQGDVEGARKVAGALDLVTAFQLIGPFENDQNSGFDVAYGPEHEAATPIDLTKRYPGKQEEVSWREVPLTTLAGRVPLDNLLSPSSWGVAYLASWLHVDRATDAVLRAEADDHLKVWLNGREAISDDTARGFAPEQHLAGVRLHPGWNQLLVKVAQRTGGWTVGLRFTGPDGAPVPGLTASTSPHRFVPASADEPWPKTPGDPVVTALGQDSQLAIPAAYLVAWRLYDLGYYRKARAAFEALHAAAPGAAAYAYGAAVSALRDEDRDHGLSGLAQASRLDPSFARAFTRRGAEYQTMGLDERAEEMAKAALKASPSDPLANDELAALRERKGDHVLAERLLALEEAAHPKLAGTALAQAQAARAQGEPLRALELFRASHELDQDGWAALGGLIDLSTSLARPKDARAYLDERRKSRPADETDLLALAKLAADYGDDASSRAALAKAQAMDPAWDAPYREAGYLDERAGDDARAIQDYGEALRHAPADSRLRDHLELLEPQGSAVASRYAVSHDEILRRAAAVTPAGYPGANAVVLLSQELVDVHRDGSSRHFIHLAAKVFDQVGADRWLNRRVASQDNFKLLYAGTITPDGLERESSSRDGDVLHFPAPSPGSTVELRYSYDEPRASATQDDYWGYFSFGNSDPTLWERWILAVPRGRPLRVSKRGKAITERDETLGDSDVRVFEERDRPRLEPEPSAPPWVDLQDAVFASTLPGWDRVASFVHAVVDDQVEGDLSIKEKARELALGAPTAEAEVAALARFVQKEIRYNQADTSVYSWRPHPAARVLASRYGDCKDKATLFIALARQLGLRADFVALRTRNAGTVPDVPVTWYNHAIAYLPEQKGVAHGRFIDLTADDLGASYLPFQDQGVLTMVLTPGKRGYRFVTTPYTEAADDQTVTHALVRLGSAGSAKADVHIDAVGLSAQGVRAAYRNPTSRRRMLDYLAGRWLFDGGAPAGTEHVSGLDEIAKPLEVSMEVAANHLLRREGDALLLRPGGFPRSEQVASQASRKLPLVLAAKNDQVVDWEYDLPADLAVARLPEPLHVDNRFFAFDASWRSQGEKLYLTTRYRTKAVEVAAADYEALRDALLAVSRGGDQDVVLREVKPADPPPLKR